MKRAYRDRLRRGCPGVRFVFLSGAESLIRTRLEQRRGHFMPPALLHSQFEALEEPGADEHPLTISIEPRPREIVEQIATALKLKTAAKSARAGT